MKRAMTRAILLFSLLAFGNSAVTSSPPTTLPAGSADYDLSWWTADGGGRHSGEQDGYTLGGTIGQPDAGVLTGDDYSLSGGFWADGRGAGHRVHLPLVVYDH